MQHLSVFCYTRKNAQVVTDPQTSPTVVRPTFQLARCGCTLRVAPQTSYSPEYITPTHTKSCNKVVVRLLSSRYQDVFALLVPSCCDKSGTSSYHLVTRLMTVTDLLQVVPTRLTNTGCS
jgi:hypothetical protein